MTINRLKKIDLFEIATKLGKDLGVRATHQIQCPFHSDTQPSARVYAKNGVGTGIYCWVCAKSWDPVEYVKDTLEIDFDKAVDWLCENFEVTREPGWNEPLYASLGAIKQKGMTHKDRQLLLRKTFRTFRDFYRQQKGYEDIYDEIGWALEFLPDVKTISYEKAASWLSQAKKWVLWRMKIRQTCMRFLIEDLEESNVS